MKWNAFKLIEEAFSKTKERLFPFNFKDWFRLGFISALASQKSLNFNSSFNSADLSSFSGNSGEKIKDFFREKGLILGGILSAFFIFYLFFSYLQSVFNFIFVDNLIEKKEVRSKGFLLKFSFLVLANVFVLALLSWPFFLLGFSTRLFIFTLAALILIEIVFLFIFISLLDLGETFKRNHSKGLSLFFFKFVISVLALACFGALISPYLISLWRGGSLFGVGGLYVFFSIFAAIALLIGLWIIFLFLYDFVVPYMYVKDTSCFFSWKQVWKRIWKNKLEVVVYWAARFLLGIGVGLIIIFMLVLIFLILVFIAILIFLILYLLYFVLGNFVIVIGLLMASILAIIFLVIAMIVVMPFQVFFRYFGFLNFEKLTELKIFKVNKNKK